MSLIDDLKQRADCLFQQGLEKYKRQRFQRATEEFRQALAFYSQFNNCPGIAKSAYNLGLIQTIQGDYRKPSEFIKADKEYREAIQAFEVALQAYQEMENCPMEAKSLYRLGLAYEGLRQYWQATECYEQTTTIFQELGVNLGQSGSELQLNRSRYCSGQKTVVDFSQCLKVDQTFKQGIKQYSQKRYAEAAALFRQS